ncbi:MAG: hypothetical protein WCT42_00130 [Candidatus Paceibacterota bacterium]
MKKMMRMLAFLGLFLSLLLVGCEKDKPETPVSVGKPTITPTFVIGTTDSKSVTVSVTVSWITQNVVKGTVNGDNLRTPNGDTIFSMKKGETKLLTFIVENASGVKSQKYLTVTVPANPLPPTINISFTFNDQVIDTLPYFGGPVVINCIFTNGALELNGIKYENSPVTFNFTVTETKTYDFKVIGPGGEVTESITVVVAQQIPPTQDEAYLCAGPWKMVKLEFQDGPGLPWYEGTISDCRKDDLRTFYFSPKKVVYDNGEIRCGTEDRTQEGPWTLRGSILTVDEYNNFDIIITQDTLVWVYHPGGQQDATRETFVRLQTK